MPWVTPRVPPGHSPAHLPLPGIVSLCCQWVRGELNPSSLQSVGFVNNKSKFFSRFFFSGALSTLCHIKNGKSRWAGCEGWCCVQPLFLTWGNRNQDAYWGNNHLLLEPFHLEIITHAQAQGGWMEAGWTWQRLKKPFITGLDCAKPPPRRALVREFINSWAPVRNKELQLQPLENRVFEDRVFPNERERFFLCFALKSEMACIYWIFPNGEEG